MSRSTGSKKRSASSKKARRKARAKRIQEEMDPVVVAALAVEPLCALFAVVDDVFTEEDAFDPTKMRAGLGRIYRQWKQVREALDPHFDEERY